MKITADKMWIPVRCGYGSPVQRVRFSQVLESIGQAGARGVGVGVASTVLASGWPAVQPGRNAADRKLPRAAAANAR